MRPLASFALALLAVLGWGARPLCGQSPYPDCGEVECCEPANWFGCDCPPIATARLEYLMWWSRGRNTPPLVTTSPQGTDRDEAGVLGFPNTTTLYGDEPIGEAFRSGGRATFNYSLYGGCHSFGGRLWGLEDRSETFFADSNGDPILARPFFNAVLNQQDALLLAFPGVAAGGSVGVRSQNDLFGADAWVTGIWYADCCTRIEAIAGYQFTRLDDSLTIQSAFTSTDPAGNVPVGTVIDNLDTFVTRNEFHGGQLGLRGEFRGACFTWELLGKVALGNMHQTVLIDGRTVIDTPLDPAVTSAGGLLALPTNMGTFERNRLAFVPEVGVNLAYDVNPCWRLSVGYTLVYWNNVVLAGNQIDPVLNLTQTTGPLVGPARPAFAFHRNDYWVQGISFGTEYRW